MPVEAPSKMPNAAGSATRPEHLPALDGVRGLAILMVLGVHLLWANSSTGNTFFDFLSAIRTSLWVGVDLFFALSGFLITGILFDSLNKNGYFRNFYARRALRIFPLYYGFLFTLICLTHPLHLHWQGKQYILLSYTQNLGIFTKEYTGFRPSSFVNLNHFWSLAVEEQFYLVWPFVVFLIRDLRKLLFVALGLSFFAVAIRFVMSSSGASPYALIQFTPCRMDSLLLGGALALVMRSHWRILVLRCSAPAFVALLCVLAWMGYHLHGFSNTLPLVGTVGFTLTALGSCALIGMALSGNSLTRLGLDNRFMRFFGKYSYGIYVFHYSIDSGLTPVLRRLMNSIFHSKAIAIVFASVLVLGASAAIAFLSYHLYEKRFLNLKRYFEPKPKIAALTAARN